MPVSRPPASVRPLVQSSSFSAFTNAAAFALPSINASRSVGDNPCSSQSQSADLTVSSSSFLDRSIACEFDLSSVIRNPKASTGLHATNLERDSCCSRFGDDVDAS